LKTSPLAPLPKCLSSITSDFETSKCSSKSFIGIPVLVDLIFTEKKN